MDAVLQNIEPLLSQYGYLALIVMILLDTTGIPAPGITALMGAGILAARGDMNIFLVFLCAWGAAVLGDNFGFLIGRFGGRTLVIRYGRFVGIRHERLEFLEHLYGRFGGWIVSAARFIGVFRQLNGLTAGIVRMPWKRFLPFEMAGAFVWCGGWTAAAYFFGMKIIPLLGLWGTLAVALVGVITIGIIITLVLRKLHAMERQHRSRSH